MNTITKYLSVGIAIIFILLLLYCSHLRDSRDNALAKLDTANQTITGLNAYITKTKEQLKAIQRIDKDYQEKLNYAKIENDKLRDSIANGTKRLYVKATCPVLANTAATSINATSKTELDRETSQRIIRITQDGDNAIMQLSALQKYVSEVCLKN